MKSEAANSVPLPFNPDVLRWAREWRGRSIEEAAQKVSVKEDKILLWESGDAVPTVRQARVLADYYDRAFLEFFLEQVPKIPETKLVPDFRIHKFAPNPRDEREIKLIQRWAEDTREAAIELYHLVDEEIPVVPSEIFASLEFNPELYAAKARNLCNYSIDDQLQIGSQEKGRVAQDIRKAIESLGVLVLKRSELGKYGVRGLTLSSDTLPVIIFGTEEPTAQAFTLCHELGHIVLQQSSMSGSNRSREIRSLVEKSERWCDEFAGAFLIPATALANIKTKPNRPVEFISDEELRKLANKFSVSRHAMLVRLVQLNYVESDYYWKKKRAEFVKQEAEFKGGGKQKYYGTRYRNSYGDTYTALVLEAWGTGRITNHDAAELMGIKNLSHLFDIRDNFGHEKILS